MPLPRVQKLGIAATLLAAVWIALLQQVGEDQPLRILLLLVSRGEDGRTMGMIRLPHCAVGHARNARRRRAADLRGLTMVVCTRVQAPLLAVVALGAYLLLSLVIGVLAFKTIPAEADLLKQVRAWQLTWAGMGKGTPHVTQCARLSAAGHCSCTG